MKNIMPIALAFNLCLIIGNYAFFSIFKERIFQEDYQILDYFFEQSSQAKNSVIFLGDSSTMTSLWPKVMKNDVFNFSLACPSTYELYSMAENNLKINKPKMVIISEHLKRLSDEEHCFQDMIFNYNLISLKQYLELGKDKNFINYTGFNKYRDYLANVFLVKMYLHPQQFYYLSKSSFFDQNTSEIIKTTTRKLENNSGFYTSNNIEEFPFEKVEAKVGSVFSLHPFEDEYLKKTIDFYNQANIKIVFVHPNYYEKYKQVYSAEYIKSMHEYFFLLEKKFPNFKYIPKIHYLPKQYFNDSIHANKSGMEFFSAQVDAIIEKELN